MVLKDRQDLELAQLNAMEDCTNPQSIQLGENALEEYVKLSSFEEFFFQRKV